MEFFFLAKGTLTALLRNKEAIDWDPEPWSNGSPFKPYREAQQSILKFQKLIIQAMHINT